MNQNLLPHVMKAYVDSRGPLSNAQLYMSVAQSAQLSLDLFEELTPVGQAQAPVNLLKRQIRWHQQTLRAAGVLDRLPGQRGVWELAQSESQKLTPIADGMAVLGFSTDLGLAIISSCDHFFAKIDEPVHLILTSPPYPLAQQRAYGNVSEARYVDWICKTLEPVINSLADGGSIALNISNDIFQPKSPARSLYVERLVLALCDNFGLYLMDRLVWNNPSKPPGPMQWASRQRVQLNVGYEPVLWFTNNPERVRSNNQRVLMPHTEKHAKLIAGGGEQRHACKSDGAYRIRPGSYSNQTAGRIPKNVLTFGHSSQQARAYKAHCARTGIAAHGAMMAYSLARFLVEFLSCEGDLVADPMAGSLTTGQACEDLSRRWICTEKMIQYVDGGASRFSRAKGFQPGAVGHRAAA
jgi:site-specific DNA-methyltransferase (cytosine-N4-specific)